MLREGGDVAGVFQQVFTKRRSLLYRTVGVSSFREPLCCRWCHGLACWSGCGHQRAGRMPSKNCSFSFFRPAQFARKLRFNEVSNIGISLRGKRKVFGGSVSLFVVVVFLSCFRTFLSFPVKCRPQMTTASVFLSVASRAPLLNRVFIFS